jgi:hypothetical protein
MLRLEVDEGDHDRFSRGSEQIGRPLGLGDRRAVFSRAMPYDRSVGVGGPEVAAIAGLSKVILHACRRSAWRGFPRQLRCLGHH